MGWKNGCVRSALGARGRHCLHAGREGWTLGPGKQGAVDPQGVGDPGPAPSQATETSRSAASLETAGVRHRPHMLTSLEHPAGYVNHRLPNECSHWSCARLRFKICSDSIPTPSSPPPKQFFP